MTVTFAQNRTVEISGEILRVLMREAGFNQETFAAAVGVSLNSIKRIRPHGFTAVFIDTAKSMANALGKPYAEFMAQIAVPADYKSPSRYLQYLMLTRSISIDRIAEKTGIDPKMVKQNASGAKEPNVEQRTAYAKAFGMSLDVFDRGWKTMEPLDRSFESGIEEEEEQVSEAVAEAKQSTASMDLKQLRQALRKTYDDPAVEAVYAESLLAKLRAK